MELDETKEVALLLMSKELQIFSQYGPGGRKCVCCGPSPKNRKAHDRTAKRRMKQHAQKQIKEQINE